MLRGHRDFACEPDYRRFVAEIAARLNHRVRHKTAEERPRLLPLPARRTSEFEEVDARVTKFGTLILMEMAGIKQDRPSPRKVSPKQVTYAMERMRAMLVNPNLG